MAVSERAFTQQNTPVFQVVHLPRITGYSKEKLNAEISRARDKEAVRRIIRLKNFPTAQLIIRVKNKNNKFSWWTISTTTGYERDDQEIILQSKKGYNGNIDGAVIPAIRQPGDFAQLLSDTLVLTDTLFLPLQIGDATLSTNGYRYTYVCANGKSGSMPLPFIENSLALGPGFTKDCPGKFTSVSIYHSSNPVNKFAYCTIRFLDQEEKESLRAVADYYEQTHPGATRDKVVAFTAGYCASQTGNPYFPQLLALLEKEPH